MFLVVIIRLLSLDSCSIILTFGSVWFFIEISSVFSLLSNESLFVVNLTVDLKVFFVTFSLLLL